MDIRVLRYFLATAREQNITRAAETLHIAQPSLSKQLMELEAELGKQLLIRGKRRITLTPDGVTAAKTAEEIVALLEKTEQEIASTDQDITGTVAIGGTPRQGILEAASALHQQYPHIRFSFHVAMPRILRNGWITEAWTLSSSSTGRTKLLRLPSLPGCFRLGPADEERRPVNAKNGGHPRRPLPSPLGHRPKRRDSPDAL